MNRNSRLPIRTSHLLDSGSSKREPRLLRSENRRTTRASSTSRISNTLRTPSLRRSNSYASLKRTPQSVQINRNRSSERQKIKKKDNRPFHDKKWQAEMFHKTQEYFQNDPEGSLILNQGKNLRPITINMFIQLVNVVLKNIDNGFDELTTTNYVDLLPKHMASLMYPGSITSSMLKTASAMHNWPHILAILSWLIGLHITMQNLETFIDDNMYILPNDLSDEEYREMQIQHLQEKFLTTSFVKWNDSQEDQSEYDNFESTLKEIYGIDTMHQWSQTVEKLKSQLEHDKNKISKQRNEIENQENVLDKLIEKKSYIENHISQQKDYIKKQENKKLQLQKTNQILQEIIEKKVEQINLLQDKIKNQTMTKQEKEMEMLRINDLKVQNDLIDTERKHQKQISDEIDIRISQMKRKIEEKLSAFNIELLKPSLKYPELKEFTIKHGSVLRTEFYEDVQSIMKKPEKLTKELQTKLEQESRALVLSNEEYEKLKNESEQLQADKNEEQLKTDDMIRKIETAKTIDLEEEKNKLKIRESLKQRTLDMKSNFPNVETLEENCKQQVAEYKRLKSKYETDAVNMLNFFQKLEIEVVHNIVPQYKEIRNQITKSVLKQSEKLNYPSIEEEN